VLVGVVGPRQKVDRFIADARAVNGVVDVTSLIQVIQPFTRCAPVWTGPGADL